MAKRSGHVLWLITCTQCGKMFCEKPTGNNHCCPKCRQTNRVARRLSKKRKREERGEP